MYPIGCCKFINNKLSFYPKISIIDYVFYIKTRIENIGLHIINIGNNGLEWTLVYSSNGGSQQLLEFPKVATKQIYGRCGFEPVGVGPRRPVLVMGISREPQVT